MELEGLIESFALLIAILAVSFVILGSIFMSLNLLRIYLLESLPQSARDYVYRHLLIRPLRDQYKIELRNSSSFYRELNTRDKKSFEKRVQRFIDSKEFISRYGGNIEVSNKQKVQIAATAMQMTHGHPQVYLSHFTKILIYPNSYYSTITKLRHQGEVNARGFIVLSWADFQKGFLDPEDGFNLGFHEMAHALQLENLIENGEYDFLDKNALSLLKVEQREIQASQERGLFRARAFENKFEFFAVAVEAFFERSGDLKETHPEVYMLVSTVLRQDPIELGSAARHAYQK